MRQSFFRSFGILSFLFFFLTFGAIPSFAHVVVKPSEVGVAAFQTFSVGVPSEKDNPTIALRLVVPSGLQEVTPNVKSGWNIDVKKTGDNVTEISWTGGSIPPQQRDEFLFSAQVPAKETTIQWKAYQTYEDGSVVAWDQDSKSETPFSETKIINDLKTPLTAVKSETASGQTLYFVSTLAFVMSFLALIFSLRKR